MARVVTLWRCKCWTDIKVIAEIDSSPPAKQTASCPKCYALHAVHADRIITITEDMSNLGPPHVPCEEKERLLAAHNKGSQHLQQWSVGACAGGWNSGSCE